MAEQFKAEAGVQYENPVTGQKVSYSKDQLADPASGFLSSQFRKVEPIAAPTQPPASTPAAPATPTPVATPPASTTPKAATPAPTAAPTAQPTEQTPAQQPTPYKIAAGDNLTKIAQKYGVGIQDILAANPQIKDPNMIYAGQTLNIPALAQGFKLPEGYERINGAQYPTTELQRTNFSDIKTDPTGTFLYGRRTDPSSAINDQAQSAFDLLNSTEELAKDTTIRKSEKMKAIEQEVEKTLGINKAGDPIGDTVKTSDGSIIDIKQDQSALGMYKQLLQSPQILALQKNAGEIQEKLDKIEASEVAFRNDILKEVEGEAPQSYIDAKVAERMKDLYPQKLALSAELRNVIGSLSAEKENAANVLQFSLQDENTRYNRMFNYLQYQAQQGQIDFSNRMAVMNYVKDLPPNRSITIGGVQYKGMAEDANLSVIQFTDENRNITVAGVDKMTGEIKYSQVIGKASAGSSGGGSGSYVKQYNETVAKQNLDILQGVNSGTYRYVPSADGDVLVNSAEYQKALESWNTGGKWNVNDETINFGGKTYKGPASSAPSALDYEVVPPSDLK